ncbi:MAG: sigma-70 family RNA polymerase sigma factor [Gaiellales bacterium]|jgi:RNA polymerase sigma-B factor
MKPGLSSDTALVGHTGTGSAPGRDELIMRYSGLVRSIAGRYVKRGFTYDDLVQCGYLGLIQAVDRYDASRGIPLRAYATRMIEGEIMHLFRDHGWAVRMPRPLQELSRRVTVLERDLAQQLGRAPTTDELAAACGETPQAIDDAQHAARAYAADSLDARPGSTEDDDSPLIRTLGREDAGFGHVDDDDAIRAAMAYLPLRQREILRLRFEDELTQSQIGEELGISQMHVSRLMRDALAKLREPLAETYAAV